MRRGIQGVEPGVFHDVMPRWLEAGGSSYIAIALAVVSFFGISTHIGWARPGLAATCLVVAVLPWVLNLVVEVPSFPWIVVTLTALALLQVGGAAWGWAAPGHVGIEQVSFLLSCWLVVDLAVARRSWASRLACLGVAATMVAHGAVAGFPTTPIWLVGLLYAYLGGLVLRTLAMTIVRLREAEGRLARDAVADEQRRIAREVHDIVAHSLAVTALHLSAARMASERGDLASTRDALADAEQLNRSSLGDLRQTVRLLRPDTESTLGTEASLPGLGQLAEIVGAAQAAGLDVVLSVVGDTTRVDDGRGLTALRVAQEALTNAVRHQVHATATVTVVAGDDLDVTVSSEGTRRPAGAPGMGLIGMRERVEAAGGEVEAGLTDRGWLVRARLPLPALGGGPSHVEPAEATGTACVLPRTPPPRATVP